MKNEIAYPIYEVDLEEYVKKLIARISKVLFDFSPTKTDEDKKEKGVKDNDKEEHHP